MSLSSFKTQFKAINRPNQFEMTLNFPSTIINDGGSVSSKSTFFVRVAEIPGATIGSVAVPYRGRFVKYAGDRTFTPLTVTVMNDDEFKIRNAIEKWMNDLDGNSTGLASANGIEYNLYSAEMLVRQLTKNDIGIGDKSLEWKFINAFPIDLSPIQLDYASNDTIEEYSITFDYDYWTSERAPG